ncbi:MAG: hypothetical protein KF889_11655 [Alphaproteobacteria bacterium]|nr:hypothetical protein [Alphaproteobacteria bacterium]MCW5739354.1 hypothetical protein [Alphaproteobacteria bacterium]
MARDRLISPEFWTREAVIDCQPMARLLLIGLSNFADDFGVQPLRPRTIRMQVFPGDAIDNDAVCAMIAELAAQGLLRLYEVDGVEYVAIVDWEQFQRVSKRARRRYPAETAPDAGEADGGLPDHSKPSHLFGTAGVSPASSEAAETPAAPGEASGPHAAPPTPPDSPLAPVPPSTPADAPALHR